MKYTAEDKGAAQLATVYDKTNDADNANDMLNYYGYAQSDYKRGDSTALKAGFSTLLDKTMDICSCSLQRKNLKISMTVFWKQK